MDTTTIPALYALVCATITVAGFSAIYDRMNTPQTTKKAPSEIGQENSTYHGKTIALSPQHRADIRTRYYGLEHRV